MTSDYPEKDMESYGPSVAEPPSAVPNDPETPVQPSMRWWGWLLSAAMILGVIGCIAFPVDTPAPTTSVPFTITTAFRPELDPSILEISMDTLTNAFNNSIPKTITMYHGQTIRVVGALFACGEDEIGPYVKLKPLSGFLTSKDTLRCYFQDATVYAQAASTSIGREVHITGIGTVTDTSISLQNCSHIYVSED